MKAEKVKRKRVTFELKREPNLQVFVAGSFNDWDSKARPMKDKKKDGHYSTTLLLSPGEYEYKFVINGEWHLDNQNPNFTKNSMGTLNSVVVVSAE